MTLSDILVNGRGVSFPSSGFGLDCLFVWQKLYVSSLKEFFLYASSYSSKHSGRWLSPFTGRATKCTDLCCSSDSLSGLLNEKENRLKINLSHKIEYKTLVDVACMWKSVLSQMLSLSQSGGSISSTDMNHLVSSNTYFIKYSFLLPVTNSYSVHRSN